MFSFSHQYHKLKSFFFFSLVLQLFYPAYDAHGHIGSVLKGIVWCIFYLIILTFITVFLCCMINETLL